MAPAIGGRGADPDVPRDRCRPETVPVGWRYRRFLRRAARPPREAGFTTLTLSELASALAGDARRLPERPVVLTFDDGFADFHRAALPLLRRYGFTATVFVTTGWIADAGRHAAGRSPGRMLCWSQIREAAAAGVEIGAHSHRHPQLDQIAAEQPPR